jgi:hypothetical protein
VVGAVPVLRVNPVPGVLAETHGVASAVLQVTPSLAPRLESNVTLIWLFAVTATAAIDAVLAPAEMVAYPEVSGVHTPSFLSTPEQELEFDRTESPATMTFAVLPKPTAPFGFTTRRDCDRVLLPVGTVPDRTVPKMLTLTAVPDKVKVMSPVVVLPTEPVANVTLPVPLVDTSFKATAPPEFHSSTRPELNALFVRVSMARLVPEVPVSCTPVRVIVASA